MMAIAVSSVITLFNTGALNAGQGSFGRNLTAILDQLVRTSALASGSGPTTITLADVGAEDGLMLAGYPSYAAIRLPRIRDADIEDVQVRLIGSQEVSTDTIASVRIMANGRRVAERVLSAGIREFEWVLPIPANAWNGTDIQLSFQLLGDLPDDLCHNERSVGAVMRFDSLSAIQYTIEDEISSVRDVVALLPNAVAISMPEGEGAREYTEIGLRLGERLTRLGYQVNFVDLGEVARGGIRGRGLILLDTPEALIAAGLENFESDGNGMVWRRNGFAHLAITDPQDRAGVDFLTGEVLSVARSSAVGSIEYIGEDQQRDGVSFERLGVDTSVQQVTQSRSWSFDYDIAQYATGRAPTHMHLDIRLPEGPGDFTNLVHTMLNNQIIDSRHIDTGRLNSVDVELPAGMQILNNDLKITVQRHREHGGCAVTAQRYPIQLLDSSHLAYNGGGNTLSGLSGLPAAFSNGVDVRVPQSLEAEERLAVMGFLAQAIAYFVPEGADYTLVEIDPDTAMTSTTPFIAANHIPTNASARLIIENGSLRIRNSGSLRAAEITNVMGLTVLERVSADIPAPTRNNPNRVQSVPGLIGFAQPGTEGLAGARIGRNTIAILHDEASTPARSVRAGVFHWARSVAIIRAA